MSNPHPWFNEFSFCGNCAAALGYRSGGNGSERYQCHRHSPSVVVISLSYPKDKDGVVETDTDEVGFPSHDGDGAFCLEWHPSLHLKEAPSGYRNIAIDGPEAQEVQS